MADVLVTWQTQIVQHPAGSQEADHFHLGLGVMEADEPITSQSHLFQNVQPGTFEGHAEVVGADGTELQTPVVFSVTVPENPPVNVPVVVSVSGQSQ
jgi:hypothetical protein